MWVLNLLHEKSDFKTYSCKLVFFTNLCYNKLVWSLSITVSTTGFHPVNASSTLAEITISQSEPESGSFLLLITGKSGLKSSVPKILSLISKCRPFGNIAGPETIDNKLSPVSYSIDYFAHVVDCIGDANITLTLKIPYPITEDDSELDDGIYDAENNTITWEVESLYNSYIEGDISIEHAIELVFEGARADDILVTTIEATIGLDDKDNDAAGTIQTLVRTPAVITFQYVDQDGNEIKEPEQAEGYVGDQCEHEIPEIEGYVIVDDGEIDLTFTEEDRAIIYHYEKSAPEVPNTSGSSKAKLNMNETNEFNSFTLLMYMLTSSSAALIILGLIRLSKRTKK